MIDFGCHWDPKETVPAGLRAQFRRNGWAPGEPEAFLRQWVSLPPWNDPQAASRRGALLTTLSAVTPQRMAEYVDAFGGLPLDEDDFADIATGVPPEWVREVDVIAERGGPPGQIAALITGSIKIVWQMFVDLGISDMPRAVTWLRAGTHLRPPKHQTGSLRSWEMWFAFEVTSGWAAIDDAPAWILAGYSPAEAARALAECPEEEREALKARVEVLAALA